MGVTSIGSIGWTLAQNNQGGDAGAMVALVLQLGFIVLMVVAMWKLFVKAGQPGWAAIVPIYNVYVLCKIAGKPGWWVILMIIPIVSIVVFALVAIALAKSFGKGVGFGIGLFFLFPIFGMILGFGSAKYQGPAA
jgi:hypothetical protein